MCLHFRAIPENLMIVVITVRPICQTRLSIWFFRRLQKFKEKSEDFVLLGEIKATEEKSLRDNDE